MPEFCVECGKGEPVRAHWDTCNDCWEKQNQVIAEEDEESSVEFNVTLHVKDVRNDKDFTISRKGINRRDLRTLFMEILDVKKMISGDEPDRWEEWKKRFGRADKK